MISFLLNESQRKLITKKISNFKRGKAVRSNDIPTEIVKDFEDVCATFIYNNYHKSLLDGTFFLNI